MFYDCNNLEYINIKNILNNFNKTKLVLYEDMFYNMPKNVVICINENIISEKIFLQIKNEKCHVIDCSNDWKLKQKNLINGTNECVENMDNKEKFNNCPSSKQDTLNNNLCKCDTNYYPTENDPFNIGDFITCYKEPKGYYLDISIYKKCYYSCKTCDKEGNFSNHNCIECNENFSLEIKNKEYINCYEKCIYYYYFDKEKNYHYTNNSSCPNNYPMLKRNKKNVLNMD